MRAIAFCAMVFLFLLSVMTVSAQSYDAKIVNSAVEGIVSVANIVVSDTFVPMTHYCEGEWSTTAVGAYMTVEQLYDNPELKGDDFSGWGWGIGGGYAVSSTFMCYAIYSGLIFNGDIAGTSYDGLAGGKYEMNAKYSMHALFAGAGFDFFGGNARWSFPLYAGIGIQRYDVSIDFPFTYSSIVPPITYRHDADVSGSGFLYGGTFAMALSGKIWRLQITTYLLYFWTINKPDLEASVHQSDPVVDNFTHEVETGRVSVLTPGLQISGIITPGLSATLSLGGFLASKFELFNNNMSHGLKVDSVAVGITYRGVRE